MVVRKGGPHTRGLANRPQFLSYLVMFFFYQFRYICNFNLIQTYVPRFIDCSRMIDSARWKGLPSTCIWAAIRGHHDAPKGTVVMTSTLVEGSMCRRSGPAHFSPWRASGTVVIGYTSAESSARPAPLAARLVSSGRDESPRLSRSLFLCFSLYLQ